MICFNMSSILVIGSCVKIQSRWIIDMEVSNDGKCKVDSQDQMSFQ